MSYLTISVREALDKLNAPNDGWYLPQVQRQYVWGARHESEDYVCLLLDSLLRGYPIGGMVLWNTDKVVPYRQFVGDYAPGQFALQVDKGRWGAAKSLVYDGQQRLQTLYSVLRHRFNGRVLHFDLLFDRDKAESDETGFLFRDDDYAPDARYLSMTELSCMKTDEAAKIALEDRVLAPENVSLLASKVRVRENISALWNIFVQANVKSIAYFPVKADSPKEVNEVFRRLNTGGIALTQLELVMGKVKAVESDYEEKLWKLSSRIQSESGIAFSSDAILQFFHLLIKNTTRIDEDNLSQKDIQALRDILKDAAEPLVEFFRGYLKGLFNINHASIIPRWLAMLPIAAFFVGLKRRGSEWSIRKLKEPYLRPIHQYFILSQCCDWNTQTMVNLFTHEVMTAVKDGSAFPLEKIRRIAIEKNRTGVLHEVQLLSQPWFTTKVLTPNRSYIFHGNKPQVDHIFPLRLPRATETYQAAIDVLWNFQPMPADINNFKSNQHPKKFFSSEEGKKYWSSYDYIPEADDSLWDDHVAFVADRKKKMLDSLSERYGLTASPPNHAKAV